jgi:hypothetical protein
MGGVAQGIGTATAGIAGAAASKYAADQQRKATQAGITAQQGQFNTQQQNIAPYLGAGKFGLEQLQSGLTSQGGAFQKPANFQQTGLAQQAVTPAGFTPTGAAAQALNPAAFTPTGVAASALNPAQFAATGMAQNALNPDAFKAPTAAEAAAMPGYQFQVEQANKGLQAAQAATGRLGGAAAQEALRLNQGLASTDYQNAYSNAFNTYGANRSAAQDALRAQLTQYGTGMNTAQGALANQSGIYGTNQAANQNALASQSGLYNQNQQTAQQAYGNQLQNFNVGNTLGNQQWNRLASLAGLGQAATAQVGAAGQNSANQISDLLTQGGNARASGVIGGANALAQLGQIPGQIAAYNYLNPQQNTQTAFQNSAAYQSPYQLASQAATGAGQYQYPTGGSSYGG